ncbi:unnamed protein product [Ixodes persulcatus]
MKIAQRLNGATRHGAAQNQDETMRGKTVIVTGANAGIGFATAMELAARGARVILACRSPCRGQRAAEAIRELTGNKEVVCKTVDMGCMHSVKAFATEILSSEPRLDVLINNAAVTERNVFPLVKYLLYLSFSPYLSTSLLLLRKPALGRNSQMRASSIGNTKLSSLFVRESKENPEIDFFRTMITRAKDLKALTVLYYRFEIRRRCERATFYSIRARADAMHKVHATVLGHRSSSPRLLNWKT